MKFSRMRKDTLIRFAAKFRLPGYATMKVGHLRDALEGHFPQYLELWMLERIKEEIIPRSTNLLMPARNRCYLPQSKLEFDLSWKSLRLAIEIQGGLASRRGGHSSAAGIRRDMRKMCLAQINGWMLLQLSTEDITDESQWSSYTKPILLQAIKICQQKLS